jgi:hypothetical protein
MSLLCSIQLTQALYCDSNQPAHACAHMISSSPTLPKSSMLVCGYGEKGLSVVQGAVPWHQVHAIRGVVDVHNSWVSELMP